MLKRHFEHINTKLLTRVTALMFMDMLASVIAQGLALAIRYELMFRELQLSGFIGSVTKFLPAAVVIVWIMYWFSGSYTSLWRFMSLDEAARVTLASVAASLLQYVLMLLLGLGVPRSFPILYPIFLSIFAISIRLCYRAVREIKTSTSHSSELVPTLMVGAGNAGAQLLRELNHSKLATNRIVCIVDDDPGKMGCTLMNIPIAGGRNEIPAAAEKYGAKEIIVAIPTMESSARRAILGICQSTGLPTRILPSLSELANGKASANKLRKVRIEDLLGRDSVRVNNDQLVEQVKGKTVLVTGGGGSIGSEICRQIADRGPNCLVIFDIYENNAYSIQMELRHSHPELDLVVLIGSVRDTKRVEQIFSTYRPQVVYHAAAHKHVPLMEDSPAEAIKNNVFGTLHVAEAADKYGAEVMVLISSDKAVNPTNIMGASKRICEMVIQMQQRRAQRTRYVAVRFGNVLGSNGSVIPLFRRQIEYGGPVTVTSKEIIRYFMTIPEAVSLVMQAGVYAKGGEIFVLDMGSPVRIDDLARNMIRLSGLEPDVDIQIVYTGLRPGEKLYEELLMSEEGLDRTDNNLIFIGHPNEFSDAGLLESLERLKAYSDENQAYDVVEEMKKLVTTFHHQPNR